MHVVHVLLIWGNRVSMRHTNTYAHMYELSGIGKFSILLLKVEVFHAVVIPKKWCMAFFRPHEHTT